MNKTKRELTGEFVGSTKGGQSFRVFEHTTFINHTTISDTRIQWLPGMRAYTLEDGDPINHISGNTYEIARTGEEITFDV